MLEATEQKSKSKTHITFAAFISTFFFFMGPLGESIDVMGKTPHVPFYIYTMTLWLISTALTFNIAAKWEKRTDRQNRIWLMAGVIAFFLMYMTATVF